MSEDLNGTAWAVAYNAGLSVWEDHEDGHTWIPRNDSNSADKTLRENGWVRVTEWSRAEGSPVADCFVRFDGSLIEKELSTGGVDT